MRGRLGRGTALAAALLAAVLTVAPAAAVAAPSPSASAPQVLLVGSYHGHRGGYQSIQAAVDAAHPGDWILVGPGDYHESPSSVDGVWITTANLHVRGMDRNSVVVDGTRPGSPSCSPSPSDQNLGPGGSGRNGIEVYETNGDTVENLTVCNFLSGSGNTGNEVWFNGGDGSGQSHIGAFRGSYLTGTSTYTDAADANLAQYALFVSNSYGPGRIDHSYGSNMGDAGYYVGACPDCNVVLTDDVATNNVLGYSGTNSGGHLLIQDSAFFANKTGIVPNSENNDDSPPPQNGACPGGATGPGGTHSCTVIRDNWVVGNNNPNVPGGQPSGGYSVIGAGIVLAGGQNDLVTHNLVAHNGSWGILVNDFPYIGNPPPLSKCQGGVPVAANICYFPAFGNQVRANLLDDNGSFANPTNGDLAEATMAHNPGNCWVANRRPDGEGSVSSDPANIQATQGNCGAANAGDIIGPLGVELACATQALGSCAGTGEASVIAEISLLAQALGVSPAPLHAPGISTLPISYPLQTVANAPMPGPQSSMPDVCAGVPANAWCPGHGHGDHQGGHGHGDRDGGHGHGGHDGGHGHDGSHAQGRPSSDTTSRRPA